MPLNRPSTRKSYTSLLAASLRQPSRRLKVRRRPSCLNVLPDNQAHSRTLASAALGFCTRLDGKRPRLRYLRTCIQYLPPSPRACLIVTFIALPPTALNITAESIGKRLSYALLAGEPALSSLCTFEGASPSLKHEYAASYTLCFNQSPSISCASK